MKWLSYISPILGSDYILHYLARNGIDTIFGYSGGANLPMFESIYKNPHFRLIINRHEQFSGFSATGYSKSSSKIPLLLTTSGPGLTNVITPLQDAYHDGVPLICISGQVSRQALGTRAFQEVDALSLTKACTHWNYQVKSIEELKFALNLAFYKLNRGPIHLDICSNVFYEMIVPDYSSRSFDFTFLPKSIPKPPRSLKSQIKDLALHINRASKPVFIVGQGSHQDYKLLRTISIVYQIPVTTTLLGLGCMDENQKESLKMLGMHGTRYANKLVQEADIIIGIGNRFDDRTIGHPAGFGKHARENLGIYHVCHDKNSIEIASTLIDSTGLEMSSSFFYHHLTLQIYHIQYLYNDILVNYHIFH